MNYPIHDLAHQLAQIRLSLLELDKQLTAAMTAQDWQTISRGRLALAEACNHVANLEMLALPDWRALYEVYNGTTETP